MLFFSILLEALHSLAANKLRSGLTMLGMIIGVASVIVMVAIGQGSQQAVKRTIASLGSNLIIISANKSGLRPRDGSALTLDDAKTLAALPILHQVAPIVSNDAIETISYGDRKTLAPVIGTTPPYFFLREWSVKQGTLFNDDDLDQLRPVAVMGKTIAERLFAQNDPVGQFINTGGLRLEVIGVLKSKGQTLDGHDQDNILILPMSTLQRRHADRSQGKDAITLIYTRPQEKVEQKIAQDYITRSLRISHNLDDGAANDFLLRDVKSVAESALKAGRIMTLLLGSIASISLIVGGIGIMNIMLVCVSERTREIGIRKAIGASQTSIQLQFLCEAVLIALAGCLVGVGIGVIGVFIAKEQFAVPVEFNGWPVVVAFTVAVATGIFFGLYPAHKAARLMPVEALRYQ